MNKVNRSVINSYTLVYFMFFVLATYISLNKNVNVLGLFVFVIFLTLVLIYASWNMINDFSYDGEKLVVNNRVIMNEYVFYFRDVRDISVKMYSGAGDIITIELKNGKKHRFGFKGCDFREIEVMIIHIEKQLKSLKEK